MSEESSVRRPLSWWHRQAYKVLGIEGVSHDGLHLLPFGDRVGLHDLRLGFPEPVADPREVSWSFASDGIQLPSEGSKYCGSYSSHIAHHCGRPQYPPGVVCPVSVADFRHTNPPGDQIVQNSLYQRTVFDGQVNQDGIVRSAQAVHVRDRRIFGHQPVEVVHPPDIVVGARYARESRAHQHTTEAVRVQTCGILDDTPSDGIYSTTPLLREQGIERHPDLYPNSIAAARDPTLCVCCFRRVLIVRHARPADLPPEETVVDLNNRLSQCLANLTLEGTDACGLVPRIDRLNLAQPEEVLLPLTDEELRILEESRPDMLPDKWERSAEVDFTSD